ncbi:MarR family transcriptional regulator [Brachybacterium vulturis]|uniref:MarR family transcriptional regulator n=1 Tax=Brachybacterium vulturis TaxID=2017484 RepID=A0A291GRD3_9MICO|nr:BlaI/MecI/CopY family transcriptional regulator [Brachybacterium vulturis]ATG52909.1 MarR family transcriptional regulator [Brachybacterium vulturis]
MSGSGASRPFRHVHLGTLEQQVMELLWEHDELTIREMISGLGDHHAYTTIATVLTNLGRKDLVTPHRVGRSVSYRPRHPRSEHAARLMEQALSSSNDRSASILRFVEGMDEREATLLREFLDGRDATGTPETGSDPT